MVNYKVLFQPSQLYIEPAEYQKARCVAFSKFMKALFERYSCNSGSIGFTAFKPKDESFSDGKWIDKSPITIWNNNLNVQKFLKSIKVYNSIESKSYTKFWLEEFTRKYNYHLLVRYDPTIPSTFTVVVDPELDILVINYGIEFSIYINSVNEIYEKLKCIDSANEELENNFIIEDLKHQKFRREVIDYGSFKETLESYSNKLNDSFNEFSKKHQSKFSENDLLGLDKTTFLKLLILGDKPSTDFLVISPKTYEVEKEFYGTFAAFLRSYTSLSVDNWKNIFKEVFPILSLYSLNLTKFYFNSFIKGHSTKSAIAAIMSRNMSHNLGSHVLSYLKYNFISTQDIINNDILKDIIVEHTIDQNDNYTFKVSNLLQYDKKNLLFKTYDLTEQNKPTLGYLIGLGKFLNYLQERQDYIATISSNIIPFSSPVNFVEFIYNELCFDTPFDKNTENCKSTHNLLLKYIAKSENYNSITIEIKLKEKTDETSADLKERLKALDVQIPGGILGRQAFFSIMENIIRNAAKHGKMLEKLIITIELDDDVRYGGMVRMSIYDNNKNGNKATEIESLLKEELTDSNGKIIETNKGLKEMKISCAWLREIYIDNFEFNTVLEVSSYNDNLCYSFFLNKPHKVAIITDSDKFSILNNIIHGWYVLKYSDFLSLKFLPRLVIVDSALSEDIKSSIFTNSHIRTFEYELSNLSNHKPCDETYNMLYKEYMNSRFNYNNEEINNIRIFINDEYVHTKFKRGTCKLAHNIITKCDQVDDDLKNDIIFLLHNDTPAKFKTNNEKLNYLRYQPILMEGISGGNSTARLIRNSVLDDLWRLKIIESALTKIVIIDERIWGQLSSVIQNEGKESRNEVANPSYDLYLRKRIMVLNMNKVDKNDEYDIYDINSKIISKFSYKSDGKISDTTFWEKGIDFVLIHQGILDKLYKTYKIKNDTVDRFNASLRSFLNCKNYIIHSGRSKPPLFPKLTPLIQYSSLENSFFDCKFTLTELIHSAITL